MKRKAHKFLPIPARELAPDSGIDGIKLRKALTHIARQGGDVRPEVIRLLKAEHMQAMALARRLFEQGEQGGLEMARRLSLIHDDILSAIYDFTTTHIVRASNPTQGERMAICAIGGYGRAEMAPGSDMDLLFLLTRSKGSAYTESVIEYMLYILWDMGFKVGHSVRTVEQSIDLCRSDQTILTSLLDLRFLSGDEDLARELFTRFRRYIAHGKSRGFITAKLDERNLRHKREGHSRYVIEPNVKEGKGGLRDLHVLYWIARFLDKARKISDPQRASDYVDMGLFDEAAASRFVQAADFLWRSRINLHFMSKRPQEILSFDKQAELAQKMGYETGTLEDRVERFMKEYFTNAREVGALTRIACAKLEADNRLHLPRGLEVLVPRLRRRLNDKGFVISNGRLNFRDPTALPRDPSQILRLFKLAGQHKLSIHPDAFLAINLGRDLIDTEFRRDPKMAQMFLDMLLNSQYPGTALRLMNEAGVLGRYILEFGGIVARTQFNMHHAYTVDEHTISLIYYVNDFERGVFAKENPVATACVQALNQKQRRCLYLACLLHDTGKGVGDQCVEGARLAHRACRRLGLPDDEVEMVAWLVRRHLDMSETAQRRDISDPETISEFAKLIGSKSRLDMLFILTIVDIRAVGPRVWNDWKGALLRELYLATQTLLSGQDRLDRAARARAIRENWADRLPGNMAERLLPITEKLGDQYWLNFDLTSLVRHARFMDHHYKDLETPIVHVRKDRPRDVSEIWIMCKDRPGLFADQTLAISASGASIIGARLHTGPKTPHSKNEESAGQVMNVFYLQNAQGFAFGRENDQSLEQLKTHMLNACHGDMETLKIPRLMTSLRADAIPVKASVNFSGKASWGMTIIEIVGRDRPGLLHDLAKILRDHKIDVFSAHIEGVGTKVYDNFYVRDPQGDGSLSALKREGIKSALMDVLDNQTQENIVARSV